ncbi:unnamed protein product [Mytilus coruscus]|uniref:Uncharacterized protein n=1 Tax=Mytilus coruscus TaxID=42192 RepID=A0A6J8DSK9_MYTCO|nr:unnamed protein product [Mytilus coruscus]
MMELRNFSSICISIPFSHFDDYEICQELCQDIICHSTGNQTKEKQDFKTNFSLYQELISSSIIYNNEQIAEIHDSELEYIQLDHKQCHLALLMDNLVHLTIKTDPLPGESRTNQICTLPLTIKGIPKDSCLVESWHGEDCDDKDPTKPGNITSANAAEEELNKTFESLTLETSIDMAAPEADPLTDVDKKYGILILK